MHMEISVGPEQAELLHELADRLLEVPGVLGVTLPMDRSEHLQLCVAFGIQLEAVEAVLDEMGDHVLWDYTLRETA
jgi:hypothetical protein